MSGGSEGLRDFSTASTAEFRDALVAWIDDRRSELEPPYRDHGSTDQLLSHQRRVQRLLFGHGFMRWGWPTEVGGFGGNPLFRAVLGEELTARGLVHSAAYSMTEVLGPAVIEYADAALAAQVVPPLLRGDEAWCQGFSEPEAGSDLGSLRTTAVRDGQTWVLQGQKLWTSWAHHATRCVVLARTEGSGTGSRGISAFFVDMDSPGIAVHPLDTLAGVDEFCETFFDNVHVPADRLLGAPGKGWQVAQHILACERGPIFWQRASWLLHHLGEIAAMADDDDVPAQRLLGMAFAEVSALRARSRSTQRHVAAGDLQPAASSIDKILIASADQAVFDAARLVLPGVVELDDTPLADRYRKEWAYSRAATIYGGTSEIQRDIVASRLLNLPNVP
jgi:alkylation response protein AidB-like acyl-CoA dehydrogenase